MRAVSALLAAVLLSFSARADETSDQARLNFQKGQTEYNLGNYSAAAKYFEETYRLKPLPALLFNIAQCYRFTGDLEKAKQTYRAFLRNAPENDKNVKLARELLEQVETALATKSKATQAAPHGLAPEAQPPATAKPNATPARTLPVPMPSPVPVQAMTAAPAPAKPIPAYTWVAGGASVVALGAGALFGLKSKSTLSGLQNSYHTREEIDAQQSAAKSDAGKATALLLGGAALAAVTGVLLVTHF